MSESKTDSMKTMFNSLLSKAQTLGKTAVDNVKDVAEKGKEAFDEHLREREANEIYRKLGKKIYKLVSRDEMTLPECCDKYIEALNDLYEDERDESGEQEACKCACDGEKCECECACECDGKKCECACDGEKCECACDGEKCECACEDEAK